MDEIFVAFFHVLAQFLFVKSERNYIINIKTWMYNLPQNLRKLEKIFGKVKIDCKSPANQEPIFDSCARKLPKICCKTFQKIVYQYFTYDCNIGKLRCSITRDSNDILWKFTGKDLCQSLFFIKVASLSLHFS